MSQQKRNRRGSLDRATVVAAAVGLADTDGVENLTMRNLADALGYKVMALYNHVGKKDELLALMVDTVIAEIADPPPDDEPMQAVRSLALSIRKMLVQHPWAAELWLRNLPGPARVALMENLLLALAASDLSPEIAHHGFHAVTNHVIGYSLQEIGMTAGIAELEADDPDDIARDFMTSLDPEKFHHTIDHVQQHLNGKTGSSFEFVLDLILDGLVRADQVDPHQPVEAVR